jgi:hypothetical protein
VRILDHLDILIPLIAVLLWFLNRRRSDADNEDAEQPRSAPFEMEDTDPEAEQRARRIQEEIRRRIAERQREDQGPVVVPPTLLAADTPPEQRDRSRSMPRPVSEGALRPAPAARSEVPPVVAAPVATSANVLAYQQQMEEQWRAIERARREAERLRRESPYALASPMPRRGEPAPAPVASLRSMVLSDLREPGSLRRAVLLREVLGPPKGLG